MIEHRGRSGCSAYRPHYHCTESVVHYCSMLISRLYPLFDVTVLSPLFSSPQIMKYVYLMKALEFLSSRPLGSIDVPDFPSPFHALERPSSPANA